MKAPFFFAAKTIGLSKRDGRKPCSLITAARHNLREIQAEMGADGRLDIERLKFNEVLMGPSIASDVASVAQQKLNEWGFKKRRKDYVQAIEMVFSLPANSPLDLRGYFQACLEWVHLQMGPENVLSAVVHLDEPAPHCHVLMLPFKEGRYVGSKLIKTAQLTLLRNSFAHDVAHKHGLRSGAKRGMTTLERNKKSQTVLNHLQRTHDPAVSSQIWPVVRHEIEINPDAYMDSLGLSFVMPVKTKKIKTSTQIMISVGRKTSQDREPRVRFEKPAVAGLTVDRNPSSVGFDQKHIGINAENPSKVTSKSKTPAQHFNGGVQ